MVVVTLRSLSDYLLRCAMRKRRPGLLSRYRFLNRLWWAQRYGANRSSTAYSLARGRRGYQAPEDRILRAHLRRLCAALIKPNAHHDFRDAGERARHRLVVSLPT